MIQNRFALRPGFLKWIVTPGHDINDALRRDPVKAEDSVSR